jgi:thymidylate synthase ThyX
MKILNEPLVLKEGWRISANAEEIFDANKEQLEEFMKLTVDKQCELMTTDYTIMYNDLLDLLNIDYDESLPQAILQPGVEGTAHLDIKGISRKLGLFIINKHVDKIGITQQSLRRVLPKTFRTNDNFAHAAFSYLRYHWLVYNGLSREDARAVLSVDSPTNMYVSGPVNVIADIINLLSVENTQIVADKSPVVHRYINTDGLANRIEIEDITPAIVGSCSVYNIDPTDKDTAYIQSIIAKGHFSILEHIGVVIEGEITVAALNQLIRHRHKHLYYDDSTAKCIGDLVKFKLRTTLRELLAMINERTCSRAQAEIRKLFDTARSVLLAIPCYSFLESYAGAKCQIGTLCGEPCDVPRCTEERTDSTGIEISILNLDVRLPDDIL